MCPVLSNPSQDLFEDSRSSFVPDDFYEEFWRVIGVKYVSDISLIYHVTIFILLSPLNCLANDNPQSLSSQSSEPEEYHNSLCFCFSLQLISDFLSPYSSPDLGLTGLKALDPFSVTSQDLNFYLIYYILTQVLPNRLQRVFLLSRFQTPSQSWSLCLMLSISSIFL